MHWSGLRPWEVERFTPSEMAQLEAYDEALMASGSPADTRG